jgi:hypothetical protein
MEDITNFERFSTWNPFIISIQGTLAAGNIIRIELAPPDAKPMKLKPRVLRVIPNQEFRWLGRILIPGIFDGERIFELRDNKDEITTFIQREIFTGILVPFLKKLLDDNTRREFESMNIELKKVCEKNNEGIPGN